MLFGIWVEAAGVYALECHLYDFQDAAVQYLIKVNAPSGLLLYHFTCLFEGQLVALLEFSVIFIVLLNSVVGEMDEWFFYALVAEREFV